MKRKPVFIVNVLVNSITHASAQKTARHHAGGPVEPFDAKLHDVSESERVTVEGLAMPDGMCSFVSVDDLDLEFDVAAFLDHLRAYDPTAHRDEYAFVGGDFWNVPRYKTTKGETKYQTPAGHWASLDGWCSSCLGHCRGH